MNRILIGFLVVIVFLVGAIYVWRKSGGIKLPQVSPQAKIVTVTPSPTFSPFPSVTPESVLPNSGVLPATGL